MPLRPPIILASASPRRRELLRNAGIKFEVNPADIPEIPHPGEAPAAFAERMALEKARVVAAVSPGRIVLAADTIVAVGSEIFGKPVDKQEAECMLHMLSGRTHQVTTGVCVLGDKIEAVRSETTLVQFRAIPESAIREYVESGEPMDKAGAYAIQGGAAQWVAHVDGDYNNVVGLPVELVLTMLRETGAIRD